MIQSIPCSCGHAERHVLARRQTFDERHLDLWSDGSITNYFGQHLHGLPTGRSPSREKLDAGWLFMGWVELFNFDEAPMLWRAALTVAKRGGQPGDVRDEFARLAEPRIHFQWTTTMGDRDGRWTEQQCRLDRFRWPGVAVFRDRSGYQVWYVDRVTALNRQALKMVQEEVVRETGPRFTNLRDLTKFLYSIAKQGKS